MTYKLVKNYDFSGISQGFGAKDFNDILEEAYKKGSRESKFTKKKSFAPSSIGYGHGRCPRFWYYAFNGAFFDYTKTDALSIANMDNGTDAGKRLARYLEQAGIARGTEVPVDHQDPPIGGFMDAMIEWKGEEIPVEIKTTRNETFTTRQAKMEAPGYQMIQLLIYMYVFNKPRGIFLVENKNTHELLILPIVMTDDRLKFVEDTFDWMRKVHKNATEGALPTRPFPKTDKTCKSCPVFDTCWKGFVKETKARNGKDPNPGEVTFPILEIPA